jgi:ammonium transporter Rh
VRKSKWPCLLALLVVAAMPAAGLCAGEGSMSSILDIQKYDRAIHIMAMLLVGFGFLMVFVKKYGRSALTATFLLVSTAIPIYICVDSFGWLGKAPGAIIDELILAEFAAASLLICAGAVLGRLKMPQYLVLGALFIPCYMLNEWIILENGFGIIPLGRFADTGGSIIIHAFGALFGLGVALTMTTPKELVAAVETDDASDRFSMLGSMVLWLFWPSFCSALVPPEQVPATVVNVILALSGATVATYFSTVTLRRKISVADIANASLAGGVAIGSTCDHATPTQSIVIGVLAGALSTFGFAVILPWLQKTIKKVDTCGVMYLHGLPGLMGGLTALFVVKGLSGSEQLKGIVISVVIALIAGYAVGKLISILGRRAVPYLDSEEFAE